MPIEGTSSLEKQVDTLVADALRGSVAESFEDSKLGVIGCGSLKRERSQQNVEEARTEKRFKVESDVGLPWNSVNGNVLDPTVPHRGVEDCQCTNPGNELAREGDHLRPLVRGTEIPTAAPIDTDLTDLLNDLDDAGDSDLDDDELGVGSHFWAEALRDTWLGNGSINENGVQAHTPQAKTNAEVLNISSEQAERDGDIGIKVQAHTPQPEMITKVLDFSLEQAERDGDIGTKVQAHTPQPETITKALDFSLEQAERDGDIGTKVQAHTPQPETITKVLDFPLEQAERDGDIGTKMQAHTPQPDTITKALDFPSEQAKRDGDIGTKVQAHTPQPETITRAVDFPSEQAERDGDIGSMMQAHTPRPDTITNVLDFPSEQAERDGDIGSMMQAHTPRPDTITNVLDFSSEQTQRDGGVGTKVQAHTPQPETITKALDFSSEQAERDGDIGTKVQAHTPQPETITRAVGFSSEQAERDGDIGSMMQAHTPRPDTITNVLDFSSEQAERDGDIGTKVQAHTPQPETITRAVDFPSEQAERDGDIGSMMQAHTPRPDTITNVLDFSSEQTQRDGGVGTKVQAHTPQPETITKALDFSSEQAERYGDIGTKVQAHTPQPETITRAVGFSSEQAERDGDIVSMMQAHTPRPDTITGAVDFSSEQAERDGDIGTKVQAHTPQPDSITNVLDFSSEQAQRAGVIGSMMQDHTPLVEPITEALGSSSEQAHRDGDDDLIMVQVHDAIRTGKPSAEIVILDSDSDDDDDLIMFDHEFENSQWKNIVKSETGIRKVEVDISQLENPVKIECERVQKDSQLENAVKVEPESLRRPETSFQFENAVKVEPENLRPLEKSSELAPCESSQLASAVKLELGGTSQVPDSSRGNHGFEAPTTQDMHHAGQEQPGVVLQTVVQDGKLMWALVPQNTDATLGSPYPVNHLHPRPPQVTGLPKGLPNGLPYGLGCSPGFAPKNIREAFSSGEQAGPSHGWIPPTTSAGVPSNTGHTQPSGMGNGNHAIAGQAVVSVPSSFQPAGNVQEAIIKGEQADGWNPPNSSAVVPYRYDTTVSTPRYEVTRALQQYRSCIDKAKDDRAKEILAQREFTSNELVREGNRRGLECRPDIVAYNDIKRAKLDVNPGVNVGNLPGVEVGDTFTYRHQMAVVGLHRLPNVGIDYGYPPPDMIPTATAIVMMPKAGYVDDKDYGSTILYTGQGGRKKRNQQAPFVCDQELKKGNLALAKNYERKLPVRVIRGHMGTSSSGPGFLGYSYDGLYSIVSYEFSDGINGFKVYKYTMERLEDQPPIPPCITGCTSHTWNTARGAMAALPLQVVDPTADVKPICMQVMDPPVEMKQICI